MASVAEIEPRLLLAISQSAGPVESDAFAESIAAEHLAVVGCMKSLLMAEMITSEVPLSTVCCAPEERRAACRGRSMPGPGRHHATSRASAQDVPHTRLVLTAEGREALDKGSPEARVLAAIPAAGTTKGELRVRLAAGAAPERGPRLPLHRGTVSAALRERVRGAVRRGSSAPWPTRA